MRSRLEALRRRRPRLAIIGVLLLVATVLTSIALVDTRVREAITGDTVEARIADYVGALARNDVDAAVAAWRLDDVRSSPALETRRHDLTATIASLGVRSHRVERIDWWRTCCEPGLSDRPEKAGLARATVEIWTNARYARYVFDVVARTTTYWGDAAGSPPHEWRLRDVYPLKEKPLFATFADPATLFPDVMRAVSEYYERYRDALLACDVTRLWDRYPDLRSGTDIGPGVNVERLRVRAACEQGYKSASFDLEAYAPLRVRMRGGGADVSIAGLEWHTDARGDSSGGQFLVTLSLQRRQDGWSIVRSDEVTLAEYHSQGH